MRSEDLYPAEPARGWIPWGALAPFLLLAFVISTALLSRQPGKSSIAS